jgi:hypothetical protein
MSQTRLDLGKHAQLLFESLLHPIESIPDGNRCPDFFLPEFNIYLELKRYTSHLPVVCRYQLPSICGAEIWQAAFDVDEQRNPSIVNTQRFVPKHVESALYYACLHTKNTADDLPPLFDSVTFIPGSVVFYQQLIQLAKKEQTTVEYQQTVFIQEFAQSLSANSRKNLRSHAIVDGLYVKQRSNAWQSIDMPQIHRIITQTKRPEDYDLLKQSACEYPYTINRKLSSSFVGIQPVFTVSGFCSDKSQDTLDAIVKRITQRLENK